MSEHDETLADIVAEMRSIAKPGETYEHTYELLCGFAYRLDAAAKRESNSIERLVRDAIIDYQEMFAHAPNDDAERDLVGRAERGNAWLVANGYEPEQLSWSKEVSPCL